MALKQEAGYYGVLVSLAGIKGKENRGRQAETSTVVVDNRKVYQLLSSNLNRLAAIIINDSGQTVLISLGDLDAQTIQLIDHAILQIDQLLPWTGFVYAIGSSVTPGNILIQEISVP